MEGQSLPSGRTFAGAFDVEVGPGGKIATVQRTRDPQTGAAFIEAVYDGIRVD